MGNDTYAPDWVEAYLEWNDQGRAENRSASSSGNDLTFQASEQFVVAYLDWIDSAVPDVRPDRSVNSAKRAPRPREVSRHVILEPSTVPSPMPSPARATEILAA